MRGRSPTGAIRLPLSAVDSPSLTRNVALPLYRLIAGAHVLVGAIALSSFWLGVFARKGSLLHRRVGRLFLLAMAAVGLTTLPLMILVYQQGYHAWTGFLAFLVLFVGTHCWMAWCAVRYRTNWTEYLAHGYRPLALLNLLAGAAILALGLATGRVLLMAFSGAGLFAGAFNLAVARHAPTDSRWWLREHLRANLNNGTATHISFLTLGLGKLVPSLAGPTLMQIGWLGPLAISIVLRIWLEVHLRPASSAMPVG